MQMVGHQTVSPKVVAKFIHALAQNSKNLFGCLVVSKNFVALGGADGKRIGVGGCVVELGQSQRIFPVFYGWSCFSCSFVHQRSI